MNAPGSPGLPSDVTAVDAAWLDAALRSAGHLDDARVVAVSAEVFGAGVGMAGQLGRLTPTYDGDAAVVDRLPRTLILKLPSPYEANRQVMQLFRYYVREALFYREIAPTASLRTPDCYWSHVDGDHNLAGLLLEDLAHLTAPDQVLGFDPALAMRAVTGWARFQAGWWETPELAALHWMDFGNGPVTMQAVGVYQQSWPAMLEKFPGLLTPSQIEIGALVGERFEWILHEFGTSPRTITHTDFRAENLLFGEPGAEDDVVVLDWQLTTRSRGVYDVAYLVSQSFTEHQRRDHESELLGAYHSTLVANGVTGYSFEECLRDYRISLMVCLVIPISVAGTLDLANDRGRLLAETIAVRAFSAVEENGAAELLR